MKLFYMCIFFLISCSTIPKGYHAFNGKVFNSKKTSCENILSQVHEKWAVSNSNEKCFFYNKNLYESIYLNQGCFIGISSDKLFSLLGAPTFSIENQDQQQYSYELSTDCSLKSPSSYYLNFLCIEKIILELKINESSTIN